MAIPTFDFDNLFFSVLSMSFTGGITILFVLLARLLLRKAPKGFSYALWGVALFRLLVPFSFESVFSLLPTKPTPIMPSIIYQTQPTIDSGIPAIDNAVGAFLPAATPYASMNPIQFWMWLGQIVWVIGIIAMVLYSIFSLVTLKKQLGTAIHSRDNIYTSNAIQSPFVLGVLRPKIYLPSNLCAEQQPHILLHEQTHIGRGDHIIKLISFFTLCLHWFNPLVWLAFFLSGNDMERSCDEKVVKRLGVQIKKQYSSSLLALATGKRLVNGTPLAFGEGDTKGRIRHILRYKQPAAWISAIAILLTVLTTIGFAANPITRDEPALNINITDYTDYTVDSGTHVFDLGTGRDKLTVALDYSPVADGIRITDIRMEAPLSLKELARKIEIIEIPDGTTDGIYQEFHHEIHLYLETTGQRIDHTFILRLDTGRIYFDTPYNAHSVRFTSELLNLRLDFPYAWHGQYTVQELDDRLLVYCKDSPLLLFSIVKIPNTPDNPSGIAEATPYDPNLLLLAYDGEYEYRWYIPSTEIPPNISWSPTKEQLDFQQALLNDTQSIMQIQKSLCRADGLSLIKTPMQ